MPYHATWTFYLSSSKAVPNLTKFVKPAIKSKAQIPYNPPLGEMVHCAAWDGVVQIQKGERF